MFHEYPVDKMDLPELEVLFAVVEGIRTKHKSQNNRFITLGLWPQFEGASHNDTIHIIGRLKDAGYIKRHTGIGMIIGLSISVTDAFEPLYQWIKAEIELRKIQLEENEEYISDEPLIYKSFDVETGDLIIGDLEPINIPPNTKMHAIMTYIFDLNKDNLSQQFDYAEISDYITGNEDSYNPKIKDAHAPISKACDRINTKIKDATDGLIEDFLKPNYSNAGYVTVEQKYLH